MYNLVLDKSQPVILYNIKLYVQYVMWTIQYKTIKTHIDTSMLHDDMI